MKKKIVFGLSLFLLLTTITSQQKIIFSKFNLKQIIIENNFLIKDKEIKKLLVPIYNKNLILLKNKDVERALLQNSFIDSFKLKKKYPNTLIIEIYEKRPIAILFYKKNKFYLSRKIDLIEFSNLKNFQNLPYVFGNKDEFKIFYDNLKKINFPLNQIKKFIYYETNRWDLETNDKKLIKLPSKNYIKSLQNYLEIESKKNFKKYVLFDYRIKDQLILK
tara:strand:- start:921 stop:1577 length:657 start_codon:yes stop_codon:yes gene_type:complete